MSRKLIGDAHDVVLYALSEIESTGNVCPEIERAHGLLQALHSELLNAIQGARANVMSRHVLSLIAECEAAQAIRQANG